VTAVFGFIENFTCLSQHARRQCDGAVDGPLRSEEVDLVPILPRFERLSIDLRGEAHTIALLDVQADDEYLGPAREVGSVFPERPIRGVVVLPDPYRFDGSVSPNPNSRDSALFRASPSYSHPR
jgi:hypothetical protein